MVFLNQDHVQVLQSDPDLRLPMLYLKKNKNYRLTDAFHKLYQQKKKLVLKPQFYDVQFLD